MTTDSGFDIFDGEIDAIHSGLRRKPKDLKSMALFVQLALERGGEPAGRAVSRAESILLEAIRIGHDTLLGMAAGASLDEEEPVDVQTPPVRPSHPAPPVVDMAAAFEALDKEEDAEPVAPAPVIPEHVRPSHRIQQAIDAVDPNFNVKGSVSGRFSSGQPNLAPDNMPKTPDDWDRGSHHAGSDYSKLAPYPDPRRTDTGKEVPDFRPTKEEVDGIIAKKKQDDLRERIAEMQRQAPKEEVNREDRMEAFRKQFADPFGAAKPAFTPSPYQAAIFDWVRNGSGHALVNAVAGSGKTTTVVEAAKLMVGRCLFLAFNRHIKAELEKRLPSNCEVMTLNGFGWKVCRDNVRGAKMPGRYDKQKDDQILWDEIQNHYRGDEKLYKQIKKPVFRVVGLLKALGQDNARDYEQYAREYGIELDDIKDRATFDTILNTVYDRSVEMLSLFSFDDQLFQPIYRDWNLPQYDWVVIDEMQDCSPIQITLAERLAASGGRILGVGDPDQSIYLFRGAHPDAMTTVAESLNATWLPLSTCYRCPDAVIEAAKEEVPRIEAPTPNAKGEGKVEWLETKDFLSTVASGDMVLCRTTAPLVKRCLEKLRQGVKAYVKGRDVSEQLIDLIEQIQNTRFDRKRISSLPNSGPVIEIFISRLDRYWNEQSYKLERAGRDIELMMLEDKVETLKALAEDKQYVVEIVKQIDRIFSDDDQEGIAFMTGHKSKGLENNRVFILRPDLCPHPKAKQANQQRQEKNLRYVMKTRAMSELYFVEKEKDEK